MNTPSPIPGQNEVHVWRTPAAVARLLSMYLGPTDVHVAKGLRGKPRLTRAQGAPAIAFNVSHSGDLRLIAVTGGREVGVDVQRYEDGPGLLDSLERFFTPAELHALDARPTADRPRARGQLWAGKEAVLKATGEGMDTCIRTLDLAPLLSGRPVEIRRPLTGETAERVWIVVPIDVGAGYAGALAVEGRNAPAVLLRDWPALAA